MTVAGATAEARLLAAEPPATRLAGWAPGLRVSGLPATEPNPATRSYLRAAGASGSAKVLLIVAMRGTEEPERLGEEP